MPVILMLQGRGINLSQEAVLASKPEYTKEKGDELAEQDDFILKELSQKRIGVTSNLSYLVNKLVPNTSMTTRTYTAPIKSKEAYRIIREDIKNTVTKAIRDDHSPISMIIARTNHYITIVGIKGDKLLVKNSLGWDPDEVN